MPKKGFSRTIRIKICSECIGKCDSYLTHGKPSYDPIKAHAIPFELIVRGDVAYKGLYQYCRHYNPISVLERELLNE